MSDYTRQLQKIVREYRQNDQPWPATAADIANWALSTKKYDLRTPAIQKVIRRDIAQAMREEYHIDRKGRRVRSKHPARINRNGKQLMLWDDIRFATHTHMQMAFTNRRDHIVSECRQVKTDVDSYNDSHPDGEPIQMILDFTEDVRELEELSEYIDEEELEVA